MKKKAKRKLDTTPKNMVAISDLNIGDIVSFLTVDFDPDAEKIERFNCGVVNIGFTFNHKAHIQTVKGWHAWHNTEYTYEVIEAASRRSSSDIHHARQSPKTDGLRCGHISLE